MASSLLHLILKVQAGNKQSVLCRHQSVTSSVKLARSNSEPHIGGHAEDCCMCMQMCDASGSGC